MEKLVTGLDIIFRIISYYFLSILVISCAHIQVVVNFLVANFFVFFVIARPDEVHQEQAVVENHPTILPELLKPCSSSKHLRKCYFKTHTNE